MTYGLPQMLSGNTLNPMAQPQQQMQQPMMLQAMQQTPMPDLSQVSTDQLSPHGRIGDVLNQLISSQMKQGQQGGIAQQILAQRFQPTDQDTATAGLREVQSYASKDGFQATTPLQESITRQLSPYTALANIQNAGVASGGGPTGMLVNRYMADNPGTNFTDALYAVQTGMRQGLQRNADGSVSTMAGAPAAMGTMKFGEQSGQEKAKLQYAGPIAMATKMGEQKAENQQIGVSSQDIIGLYNKLQQDAVTAPSGVLESGIARASNAMNMPTQGAIAQGTFDADLNNLYLATIRSLKGTGRVMEQELVKIGEAAPKSTDSMQVKIAKAQAHMEYYTQRMKSLGYNPTTGQPQSDSGQPATQLQNQSFQEGQTATNKQTGQKAIFKNGQWQAVQ